MNNTIAITIYSVIMVLLVLCVGRIIYLMASGNKSNAHKDIETSYRAVNEDRSWYKDSHINTLFNKLFAEDNVNDFIAPSQLGGATGNHAALLEFILSKSIFSKSSLNTSSNHNTKNLFIPLNIGARATTSGYGTSGSHWILGCFRFDAGELKEIFYFDSLGDGPGELFRNIANHIKEFFNNKKLEITNLSQKVQNDGHSCGPWTVKAAEILKDTDELSFHTQIQNVDIQEERKNNKRFLNNK